MSGMLSLVSNTSSVLFIGIHFMKTNFQNLEYSISTGITEFSKQISQSKFRSEGKLSEEPGKTIIAESMLTKFSFLMNVTICVR